MYVPHKLCNLRNAKPFVFCEPITTIRFGALRYRLDTENQESHKSTPQSQSPEANILFKNPPSLPPHFLDYSLQFREHQLTTSISHFNPFFNPIFCFAKMPAAEGGPQTLYDKVFQDHIVDERLDGTILLYIGV